MSSPKPVDLYTQSKVAITSLVTEQNQDTNVPACPDWTLRELVAHLVGSFEDVVDGNADDLGQPHWTAAQVERYSGSSLHDLFARWEDVLASAGERMGEIAQLDLPDIAVHEFDVRGAIGNQQNRDAAILAPAVQMFVGAVDQRFQSEGLNAVEFVTDEAKFKLGPGEPAGEVHTSVFELSRMFTGRRSRAQIRQMDSTIQLDPWLDNITVMPPRQTELHE